MATTTIPSIVQARSQLGVSARQRRPDLASRRADMSAATIAASIRSEVESGHYITRAHAAELSAMLQAVAR